MALLAAQQAVALDAALVEAAEIQYSTNGTTEDIDLRTALTGTPPLKAATVANPSVKATNGPHESGASSTGNDPTHFRFAKADHTPLTTFVALADAVPLSIGGTVVIADGDLKEQLAQDDDTNVDA